jgi:2-polyprenyl-3-methyl-5-hydroxy-6-metoxy-1,4-benzoquinol methylase
MTTDTTSEQFFERMYRADSDPWRFAENPYELRRYAALVSAVDHQRYRRVLEPGCSVGVLTEQLASFCDEVDAFDIASSAVATARLRCRELTNVRISSARLDEDQIVGSYDLIVFSEIGYYFQPDRLGSIAGALATHLMAGGVIVAAHWLGHSKDHLISGDAVHDVLRATFLEHALKLDRTELYPEFRLDRWTKL